MELGLQQDGCVVRYVVVHELLHSLGFKHEQNRPDRDEYIDMHWDNIQAGGASQFYIETWVDTEPTITEICDQSGKPAGEAGTENLMPGVTTPPLQGLTTPIAGVSGSLTPAASRTTTHP